MIDLHLPGSERKLYINGSCALFANASVTLAWLGGNMLFMLHVSPFFSPHFVVYLNKCRCSSTFSVPKSRTLKVFGRARVCVCVCAVGLFKEHICLGGGGTVNGDFTLKTLCRESAYTLNTHTDVHHLFSPSSLCYSFCALPRSRSWFMCGLAHKQHRNTNTFLLTVYLGNEVIKHASDVFPPSSACKSKIPDFLEYIIGISANLRGDNHGY